MNDSQTILKIIVENINNAGLTEKDCLKACDIGANFLTDWKSGKSKFPAYDKIVKLSQFLKIDLNYLFIGEIKQMQSFKKSEIELIEKFNSLYNIDQKRILKQIDTYLEDYPNEANIDVKHAARIKNENYTENISQSEIKNFKNAKAQKY